MVFSTPGGMQTFEKKKPVPCRQTFVSASMSSTSLVDAGAGAVYGSPWHFKQGKQRPYEMRFQ